jgi:ribose 5-phosphate isomerase A
MGGHIGAPHGKVTVKKEEPQPGSASGPEALALVSNHVMKYVSNGAGVGLGSGRASTAFIRALGERVKSGGLRVRCVPTSEATARLAREIGLPLVELDGTPLDVTVDGADEVDPNLDCVKGWGGALVRERIVAAASKRQILLVGSDKLVPALGTKGKLPVEVNPFAVGFVSARLAALGLKPEVRKDGNRTFITDNGNVTVDCGTGPIADPHALERAIRAIPGVIDTGLFLGTAHTIIVAEGGEIRELTRKEK